MSAANPKPATDWTHLLSDPELVSHIGKLLQAYRDAAPDQREQALIEAMRRIKLEAASKAKAQPAPAAATTAPTPVPAPAPAVIAEETKPVPVAVSQPEPPVAPAKPEPAAAQKPEEQPASHPPVVAFQPPFQPTLLTPSVGEDRRRYPRLKCFIAVELRPTGNDVPVWGNLANVSAGGCYIETLTPVSNGTKLEVGLWVNNGKVWVKGIVLNGVVVQSNPCFGIRVKFTDMNADERETFRFFLGFVEGTTKNYEKQNGYLAQLKR